MTPGLRKILLFVLGFAPLFVLFLWFYPKILPKYERLVLAVANPFLGQSSPPLRMEVDARGDLAAFATVLPGQSQQLFGSYAPHVIYLSLVFLPALILATPVAITQRLRNLILGVLILFALHALTMIVLLKSYLCLQQEPSNFSCFWVHGVALTSGQVMGFAVWALTSWGSWFPRHTAGVPLPVHVRIGRNAACHCGSGRKYKYCCGK